MAKVTMLNMAGEAAGEIELNDEIFGIEINEFAVHEVIKNYLANQRQGTQSAKTRGEVRGGGRKPFRQKGTGRARQGSIRAPQWTGGGVVFAPKPRDFSQKINKQMKRGALCCALSGKVADEGFVVVDEIKLAEAKTKEMVKVLDALKIDKRVLLVVTDADEAVVRAANNIPSVTTISTSLINVYDVMANEKLVITKEAVKKIEEAYKA